jgi:hypothetical protein
MGAIFYLVMDMAIHWGVFRNLRKDVNAKGYILISALLLDLIVLSGFLFVKGKSDPFIIIVSVGAIILVTIGEKWFLNSNKKS